MTVIKDNGNGTTSSFAFVAPEGISEKLTEELFPVSEAVSEDYAAAIALDINQMKTFVTIAALTGNLALTAAVDAQVSKGAIVVVKVTADTSNRTVSFGSGMAGANIIVTASTSRYIFMVYDGTSLVVANQLQADYSDSATVAKDYAATVALAPAAHENIVNVATLTGDVTITATTDAAVKKGAKMFVKLTSDTTARDATFSTGFEATVVAGVISKTKRATFVYDGTNWCITSAIQVD